MNVYQSVHDSLYAFIKKFIDDNALTNTTIYNFDAFSQQNELPAGDLLGVQSYSLTLDRELATMSALVCVSTDGDENLFRLNDLSGQLFVLLAPDSDIKVYESGTTNLIGNMRVMNGTSISPVYRAIQRPVKMISVRAGLGLAVKKP